MRSDQGGLTLIELIVSASIFVLIAGILYVVMLNISTIFLREKARTETSSKSRAALDLMLTDLQEIARLQDNYPWVEPNAATHPCHLGTGTLATAADRLIATVPSVDAAGAPVFTGTLLETDTVLYYTVDAAAPLGWRLCRAVVPNVLSSRPETVQELMNNLTSDQIWSFEPGSGCPGACNSLAVTYADLNFTLEYVNERTGEPGFLSDPIQVSVSQRFNFRNQ